MDPRIMGELINEFESKGEGDKETETRKGEERDDGNQGAVTQGPDQGIDFCKQSLAHR